MRETTITPEAFAPLMPPGRDLGSGPLAIVRLLRLASTDTLQLVESMLAGGKREATLTVQGKHTIIMTRPEDLRVVLLEHADVFEKDADYTDEDRGLARFTGKGLLTNNGAAWKRQRKLVAPALHARRIEAYAETMSNYTREMVEGWADGQALDLSEAMMNLTLRIVGRTLFDVDVRGETARPIYESMETMQQMNGSMQVLPSWLPTPKELSRRKARRELDRVVYSIIAARKAEGVDRGDLLSMLLASRDEDGQPMPDQQVRDEAVTLFLAGHETTANALTWTFMLLAQNPDIKAKLQTELDGVLEGRTPVLDDMGRLPYTHQVVKESMRLFPPAWAYSRVAMEDTTVNNWRVPKGAVVVMPIYSTHRDPTLWPDAERFDPERFSPEREPQIPRYAYLPFGGGPRICIGNHFAMMEAVLLLAGIAQRYDIGLATDAPVAMRALITLTPKDGLPVVIGQR